MTTSKHLDTHLEANLVSHKKIFRRHGTGFHLAEKAGGHVPGVSPLLAPVVATQPHVAFTAPWRCRSQQSRLLLLKLTHFAAENVSAAAVARFVVLCRL